MPYSTPGELSTARKILTTYAYTLEQSLAELVALVERAMASDPSSEGRIGLDQLLSLDLEALRQIRNTGLQVAAAVYPLVSQLDRLIAAAEQLDAIADHT